MTCLGLGAGLIGIYGFFVPALSREFGVGVGTLNIGPVALLLVPGLVAPLVGSLADRVSIRRMILVGCTFAMLSLFLASRAESLALVAMGFLGFSLGLTLYGPVVVNGLMVKLYPGREGKALAAAAMGISVASALLPPLAGALIQALDWRTTLAVLSLGVLLVLWLVVLAGLPPTSGGVAAPSSGNGAWLYRQRAFWLVGITMALGFNVAIIMAVSFPPLFMQRGLGATEAGLMLSVSALAGLAGKGLVAAAADRLQPRARGLVLVLLLLQVGGLLLLLLGEGRGSLLLALCLWGLGGGAFIPIHAWLNARYFDAAIIGRVNGSQMPLFLPLGLVGPPLAGYAFDQSGHYQWVLIAMAALLVLAGSAVMALPRPRNVAAGPGSADGPAGGSPQSVGSSG